MVQVLSTWCAKVVESLYLLPPFYPFLPLLTTVPLRCAELKRWAPSLRAIKLHSSDAGTPIPARTID